MFGKKDVNGAGIGGKLEVKRSGTSSLVRQLYEIVFTEMTVLLKTKPTNSVKPKKVQKRNQTQSKNVTKQNHILHYSESQFHHMRHGLRVSTGPLLVKASLNRNSSALELVSGHPAGRELTSD